MALFAELPEAVRERIVRDELMCRHTSLRVGGPADLFFTAHSADELALVTSAAQRTGAPTFILGGGTNLCVSDQGIRGLVIRNRGVGLAIGETTMVETGHMLMDLFLKTARAGLSGLEFAVGIPGTVGGALVSNAGAYRESIAPLVTGLNVVEGGIRRDVPPDWMGFRYRDTRLRGPGATPAVVVSVTLHLTPAPYSEIHARARENQWQRIHRQPWYPSAGSFFKNVNDHELAQRIPDLPAKLREAGVVPAGYMSAACDCKGLTVGGAQISRRHANFVVNRGHATAAEVRALANEVRRRVFERFGVELHEEVIYAGDWQSASGTPSR